MVAGAAMADGLAACVQEDVTTDTRAWRDVLDVSSYCWDPERVTSYDFGVADRDESKVCLAASVMTCTGLTMG
jgi:hypothetical protein